MVILTDIINDQVKKFEIKDNSEEKGILNSSATNMLVNQGYDVNDILENQDNEVVLEGSPTAWDDANMRHWFENEDVIMAGKQFVQAFNYSDRMAMMLPREYGTSVSAFSPLGGAFRDPDSFKDEDYANFALQFINKNKHNLSSNLFNWGRLGFLEDDEIEKAFIYGRMRALYDDYFNAKPLPDHQSPFFLRRGQGDANMIALSTWNTLNDPLNVAPIGLMAGKTWQMSGQILGKELTKRGLGPLSGPIAGAGWMGTYSHSDHMNQVLGGLMDEIDWEETAKAGRLIFPVMINLGDEQVQEAMMPIIEAARNGDELALDTLREHIAYQQPDIFLTADGVPNWEYLSKLGKDIALGAVVGGGLQLLFNAGNIVKMLPSGGRQLQGGFLFPTGVDALSPQEIMAIKDFARGDAKLYKQLRREAIADKKRIFSDKSFDEYEMVRLVESRPFIKQEDGSYLPNYQKQEYNIANKDTKTVANNIVDDIESIVTRAESGDEAAIEMLNRLTWYRDVVSQNREIFGGTSDVVMDVASATSPGKSVRSSVNMTFDIMERFTKGYFDDEIAAFNARLAEGKVVNNKKLSLEGLKDFPKIRTAAGRLYGTSSLAATEALVGAFGQISAGKSPKTIQFLENLKGTSNEATIDVWAARYLRRLSGENAIHNVAEKGVGGKHLVGSTAENPKIGGDFGAGQKMFNAAKDQINNSDLINRINAIVPDTGKLNADDLQAIAWYSEQSRFGDYKGGSIADIVEEKNLTRTTAGISGERLNARPTNYDQAEMASEITSVLAKDTEAKIIKAQNTYGRYDGVDERALDVEIVHTDKFDDTELVNTLKNIATEKNQDSFFVSTVVRGDDVAKTNEPLRPGIEIYFDATDNMSIVNDITDELNALGADGFTFVTDLRQANRADVQTKSGSPDSATINGIRLQYIPEYDPNFKLENFDDIVDKQRIFFATIVKKLLEKKTAIKNADVVNYKTKVYNKDGNDYKLQELQ